MPRRRHRIHHPEGSTEQALITQDPTQALEGLIAQMSDAKRLGAMIMFFILVTPLILLGLLIAYQLWHAFQGRDLIDSWTFFVVVPFGIVFSPVLFYLGWYFETRAQGKKFELEATMGGRFRAYCSTLYGLLAVVTVTLAVVGAIGTALVDSNLAMISWAGTAFVGIGLVSWVFHTLHGEIRFIATNSIKPRPTGIGLVMFSVVWLYPCAVALRRHDWFQFRGAIILFLLFLLSGIIAIWLSYRIHHRDGDTSGRTNQA